jgi:hypothetical protein
MAKIVPIIFDRTSLLILKILPRSIGRRTWKNLLEFTKLFPNCSGSKEKEDNEQQCGNDDLAPARVTGSRVLLTCVIFHTAQAQIVTLPFLFSLPFRII